MNGKVNKPQGQARGAHGDTQAGGNDLPTRQLRDEKEIPPTLFPGTALKWKSLPLQGFWHRSTCPILRDKAKPLRMPAFHSDAGVCQVSVKPGCSWPGPERSQPGAPVSWGFQPGTWSAKCVRIHVCMCACVHVCTMRTCMCTYVYTCMCAHARMCVSTFSLRENPSFQQILKGAETQTL